MVLFVTGSIPSSIIISKNSDDISWTGAVVVGLSILVVINDVDVFCFAYLDIRITSTVWS